MANKLTNNRDVRFELCFKYPLQRGFTFRELSVQNNKEFQRFLDKVSNMTVQQVDESFARKPDKTDTFSVSNSFLTISDKKEPVVSSIPLDAIHIGICFL